MTTPWHMAVQSLTQTWTNFIESKHLRWVSKFFCFQFLFLCHKQRMIATWQVVSLAETQYEILKKSFDCLSACPLRKNCHIIADTGPGSTHLCNLIWCEAQWVAAGRYYCNIEVFYGVIVHTGSMAYSQQFLCTLSSTVQLCIQILNCTLHLIDKISAVI